MFSGRAHLLSASTRWATGSYTGVRVDSAGLPLTHYPQGWNGRLFKVHARSVVSDMFLSLCSGVSHYWVIYPQVLLVPMVLMTPSGCGSPTHVRGRGRGRERGRERGEVFSLRTYTYYIYYLCSYLSCCFIIQQLYCSPVSFTPCPLPWRQVSSVFYSVSSGSGLECMEDVFPVCCECSPHLNWLLAHLV